MPHSLMIIIMADKRVKDMRERLNKTMVHNPIYDRYGTGPVYESIKPPKLDTPTLLTDRLEATNRPATATSTDQQNISTHSQSLHSFPNKCAVSKHIMLFLLFIKCHISHNVHIV